MLDKEELMKIFIDDCVDIRGYSKEEAQNIFREHWDKFYDDLIDAFWLEWGISFPVGLTEDKICM